MHQNHEDSLMNALFGLRKFTAIVTLISLTIISACDNDSNPVSDEDGNAVISLPEEYIFRSLQFVSNEEGWIVGDDSIILHTVDGGKSWEQQESDVSYSLMKVQFIDSDCGWITGTEGVLHTEDGGQTWTEQLSDSELWVDCDMCFIDRSTGWVCGPPGGIVYTTSDGGNLWNIKETGRSSKITSICFIDKNIGYACSCENYSEPYILKTIDGGINWTKVYLHLDFWLNFTVHFVDEQTGFVGNHDMHFDNEASIYRTNDGGVTWIKQEEIPKSSTIFKIYFIDKVNGWAIGGKYGTLMFTQDGGGNWVEMIYSDDESILTMDFYILDDTLLYVLTTGNEIFKIYL